MQFRPSKNDRPVFGKLANEYNLTYYGTVVPDEVSDYIPVRGMTASPEQVDDNYTTGTVAEYHVQLLQRTHDIYLRDNRKVERTWTLCQIDINHGDLPHLILGGKSKSSGNESELASYLRMYEINIDSLDCPIADDFANKFAVFVSPQDVQRIKTIFTPEFQAMLSLHFADHDFEINDNKLYVYTIKQPIELRDVDELLRIAVWLAKHIDSVYLTQE